VASQGASLGANLSMKNLTEKVYWQVDRQIWRQFREQVRWQVYVQVWEQVSEQVSWQVWEQIYEKSN